MPRLAIPEAFHPRLQFRYQVFSSRIPTAFIHARSAEQPSVNNNPVQVNVNSHYIKMKGRSEWNDIKLSCYQYEGITENELYNYFNGRHFDVAGGNDKDMSSYKHMMLLFLLNPLGAPTGIWKLTGAFISDVSWGSMDYGSDDVIQAEITIAYDYAELN